MGDEILSSQNKIDFKSGNAMPLFICLLARKYIVLRCFPELVQKLLEQLVLVFDWYQLMEMTPPLNYQAVKLGLLNQDCLATIGSVGNGSHQKATIGKAGRSRWLGKRPRVRGVAMNPVDHPMGGGEGSNFRWWSSIFALGSIIERLSYP